MKIKLLLLSFLLCAGVALSACGAPKLHETKTLYHPLGEIGLGMTIGQIERILGESETTFDGGDSYLVDYESPDADVVVHYGDFSNEAFLISSFSFGKTYNGAEVGMDYEELLALSGQYAFEHEIEGREGRLAISLYFNSKNKPISVSFIYDEENEEEVQIFSDIASHRITYEFWDYSTTATRVMLELL